MVYIITTWCVSAYISRDNIFNPLLRRYTRHEVQTRYILYSFLEITNAQGVRCRLAAFYIVGILVGGFSAIFAYLLTLLGGRNGIAGWAWIFVSYLLSPDIRYSITDTQIIEGAITIGFGIIAWFFLPNFPDQNIFLTREETRLILQRVEHDRGDSIPDVLSKEKLVGHLLDWKVWAFGTT